MAVGWTVLAAQSASAEGKDIDAATGRDVHYVTEDAMYLANEE